MYVELVTVAAVRFLSSHDSKTSYDEIKRRSCKKTHVTLRLLNEIEVYHLNCMGQKASNLYGERDNTRPCVMHSTFMYGGTIASKKKIEEFLKTVAVRLLPSYDSRTSHDEINCCTI